MSSQIQNKNIKTNSHSNFRCPCNRFGPGSVLYAQQVRAYRSAICRIAVDTESFCRHLVFCRRSSVPLPLVLLYIWPFRLPKPGWFSPHTSESKTTKLVCKAKRKKKPNDQSLYFCFFDGISVFSNLIFHFNVATFEYVKLLSMHIVQ